jgi:hypothetical protein
MLVREVPLLAEGWNGNRIEQRAEFESFKA